MVTGPGRCLCTLLNARTVPHMPAAPLQTHAILVECYNPISDCWEHVELPSNANPRRSFLAACGLE